MGIFAIHYTYPADMTEAFKIRAEHREWLSGLPGLRVAGMYHEGHDEFSEGEETVEEPPNGALIEVPEGVDQLVDGDVVVVHPL